MNSGKNREYSAVHAIEKQQHLFSSSRDRQQGITVDRPTIVYVMRSFWDVSLILCCICIQSIDSLRRGASERSRTHDYDWEQMTRKSSLSACLACNI